MHTRTGAGAPPGGSTGGWAKAAWVGERRPPPPGWASLASGETTLTTALLRVDVDRQAGTPAAVARPDVETRRSWRGLSLSYFSGSVASLIRDDIPRR